VIADLVVEVRSGAVAGAADVADDLADADVLAGGDAEPGEVGIARGKATGVADADQVAVSARGRGVGDATA
jgi:hypothetical protein